MDKAIEEAAAVRVAAAHDAGDKRSENALNKALYHYLSGVRPLPTTGGYLVPSATTAGTVYRVSAAYGCACEAGAHQLPCWHASLVEILDAAQARTDQRAAYLEAVAAMDELYV